MFDWVILPDYVQKMTEIIYSSQTRLFQYICIHKDRCNTNGSYKYKDRCNVKDHTNTKIGAMWMGHTNIDANWMDHRNIGAIWMWMDHAKIGAMWMDNRNICAVWIYAYKDKCNMNPYKDRCSMNRSLQRYVQYE